MTNTDFLFHQKWKIGLALILVISLTFLDKIIPPFGIPISLLMMFLLFRWKKLPIRLLGLYAPKNWTKIILLGLIIGILIQVFSTFVQTPILEWLGIAKADLSNYETIEGNNSMLILFLVISWTTAGLGEELIYRAFFLGQLVVFFENSKYKWIISLSISSIIFGLLHFNNGLEAIIGTGITGFFLGLVYLKTDRNIWAAYIAHGIADTIAVLLIYTGMYKDFI